MYGTTIKSNSNKMENPSERSQRDKATHCMMTFWKNMEKDQWYREEWERQGGMNR